MNRSLLAVGSDSGLRPWREAVHAMPGYETRISSYTTRTGAPLPLDILASMTAVRRESEDADAILAISTLVGGVAAVLRPRKPVVAIDIGGGRAVELLGRGASWGARAIIRLLASVLALTTAHAGVLQEITGSRIPVRLIHQPATRPPALWNPQLAAPYFVCAGSSGRDLRLLCDAAKDVSIEVRLIFGGGELVPARGTKLPNSRPPNLVLYGRTSRDAYFQHLTGASALIHPLPPSNYPVGLTVLLDAMAMGVPILATDVSSVSEYQGTNTAALVAAGDASALAELMRRAIDDGKWARSLSIAARRHALSSLAPSTIGRELAAGLVGIS